MGFMIGMGRWTWAFCGLHDADRMCTRCIHPIVSCTLGMVYYSLWHYGSKHLLRRYLTTQIRPQPHFLRRYLDPWGLYVYYSGSDSIVILLEWDSGMVYLSFTVHSLTTGENMVVNIGFFPHGCFRKRGTIQLNCNHEKHKNCWSATWDFCYIWIWYISIWIAINF